MRPGGELVVVVVEEEELVVVVDSIVGLLALSLSDVLHNDF